LAAASTHWRPTERALAVAYCFECGEPLVTGVPPGEDRKRQYCPACGYVHYLNPRILVSCIVHDGERVLWVRRGQDPQKNLWAMPAGFMENDETLQQAAVRELEEETGLRIPATDLDLVVLSSLAFINEVYVVFEARHEAVELQPVVPETLEVRFLAEAEAPWDELAYPYTEPYMRRCYQRLRSGEKEMLLGAFSHNIQQLKNV
tara:strand:+ start:1500 stop:2111 length:612 start_codon:yes stop_codon:yes gene_type:complete